MNNMAEIDYPDEILPTDIVPRHYNINLKLDLHNYTFDGFAHIDINIENTTSNVILNAENLNIKSAHLLISNNTLEAIQIIMDENYSKCTIKFPEELTSGLNACLKLKFTGIFDGENFYNSINISEDGIPSIVAAVQFNLIGVRRLFPCWDDLKYKTTFGLTLVVSQELTALSNMPIKCITEQKNLKTVVFDVTPLIAIQSIAIVVGEFDFIETMVENTSIKIYTQRNQSDQAKFAFDTIIENFNFYTTYFKFPYPLPKLDCICLPFSLETTDSWGLLTFSESYLLTNSKTNITNTKKQSIRLQISRKLVGQWIKSLISPKNRQELWFYDGLTIFFQYMSVSELYLENGSVFEDFVSNQLPKVFELDSRKETLPIVAEHKASKIHDEIKRVKIPSLMFMLQTLIGPEMFRETIATFMKDYAYQMYGSEDLWQVLEDVSNQPVKDIILSWTKQAGYPILSVEQRQEEGKRILSVSQKRFMIDGTTDESIWVIPVSILTADNPLQIRYRTIIPANREVELVLKIGEDVWMAFHVAYYRVLYSEDIMNQLIPVIKNKNLHEMHRYSILNDLFYSAKAGYVSTKLVLNLLPTYQHDKSYIVWNCIVNILSQIGFLVSHLPAYEEFVLLCIKLYSNISEYVGWDERKGESYLTPILRSLILQNMAFLQDPYTINEAKRRFDLHMIGSIEPDDSRASMYIGVISSGNDLYLQKLLHIYVETESQEEKARVFLALGAARDESMIKKVLKLTISDLVNPKYGKLVFQLMSVSQTSRGIAWQFVKDNWIALSRKYCGEYMSCIKKWITQGFATETLAKDVETFLKSREKFFDDPVDLFLEPIMINVKWLERDCGDIERTLLTFSLMNDLFV